MALRSANRVNTKLPGDHEHTTLCLASTVSAAESPSECRHFDDVDSCCQHRRDLSYGHVGKVHLERWWRVQTYRSARAGYARRAAPATSGAYGFAALVEACHAYSITCS